MVVSKAASEVESVNESVAGNSNDHTSSTGKDMLDRYVPPSPAAGTAALGPTSSRPRRGAAAAAASTISQLALSEVQSSPASEDCWPLPSGWTPVLGECRTVLGKAGPSSNETGPSPSETGPSLSETGPVLSEAGPAPSEIGPSRSEALPASSANRAAPGPESCEVCAAPLPEAVSADTVARQTAAALLGTAAAVSWLCRPCADLLGLIDLSQRQLQAMEEQLRQRHRDGSRRKQIIPDASKVKKEPKDMGECFDESEQGDREDEGPQQEVEECGVPAEEMIEPAAVTVSDAAIDAATAGRKRRLRRAANATKQCSTCGRQFNSWRSLDSHVNVHTGTRPFACTHCERRFPSKAALRQHSGKHSNKWACELCGKLYSTEPALSTHRSYVHFPERLKRLVCNICDKTFLGQKRYTKHMSTHAAEARRFSCPEPGCHSSFKTRNALNVHACKHRGKRFACDQCPALFFSKASMQQHMVRHGSVEAQFPCPHCPRRFIYASILKCHLASSHNAERDRVCEVCGATFTCNSALNAHKLAHQDERPFVCSTCGAAFKRKQVLTRHMRFVHEHEVAVHCEHCDKGFQTLYKLKVHLRTHTGERPFACPCCPKRFTQRSHVRSHMQMHALPGGGVPAPPCPPAELEATPVAPLQVMSVSAGLTAELAAAGALVDVLAVVPAAAGS